MFFFISDHQLPNMDTEQTSNNISTMDVPVVFIKPEYGQSQNKISRVKRATVVGNPMFSSTVEDDNDNEECLSLDDLDMDYEQIMHYFDNLKVRIVYIYTKSQKLSACMFKNIGIIIDIHIQF